MWHVGSVSCNLQVNTRQQVNLRSHNIFFCNESMTAMTCILPGPGINFGRSCSLLFFLSALEIGARREWKSGGSNLPLLHFGSFENVLSHTISKSGQIGLKREEKPNSTDSCMSNVKKVYNHALCMWQSSNEWLESNCVGRLIQILE